MSTLAISHVSDFRVTGSGAAQAWKSTEWHSLQRVKGECPHATQFKTLWSDKGIYFLIECEDRRLACKNLPDFANLYEGDVVEVFLQPDPKLPVYFEYELSPLGAELPIMVPNRNHVFYGWRPWHYDGPRKVRRGATVRGGPAVAGGKVTGWTAEFFIPFALLYPLLIDKPEPGTRWRGNVYRIDYDVKPPTFFAWCPKTGFHFHDFKSFGEFQFQRGRPSPKKITR